MTRIGTVSTILALTLLQPVSVAVGQLSTDNRRCLDAVYNGSRKVVQQELKGNWRDCIRRQSGDQTACIDADRPRSVDEGTKMAGRYNAACTSLPAFGVSGTPAEITDAAQSAADQVVRNKWGSPVDPDDGNRCHDKIAKRVADLGTEQWKEFRKCVKDFTTINGIGQIESCIGDAIADGTAEEGDGVIRDVTGGDCAGPIPRFDDGDCAGLLVDDAAQCIIDNVECEVCKALNVVTGGNADCSTISGISCVVPPPVHKCTFDGAVDDSSMRICFLGVCPPAFDIAGAIDITCDPLTQDANGKRDCQCGLQTFDPFVISGIGTVCVEPIGPCSDGEVDCDGGNQFDVDIVADHTTATCTSNPDCEGQCASYCSGLGYDVLRAECEGFCQGGTRPDQSCICDRAGAATCTGGVAGVNDCLGGLCAGKDNDLGAPQCHCICVDAAAGSASPAGSLSCRLGLSVRFEPNEDGICDGVVLQQMAPLCAPFTSGSSTGIILNDNENPGSLGPYSELGAPMSCSAFDSSMTTGLKLVSTVPHFDLTWGDMFHRWQIDCQ